MSLFISSLMMTMQYIIRNCFMETTNEKKNTKKNTETECLPLLQYFVLPLQSAKTCCPTKIFPFIIMLGSKYAKYYKTF